MADPLRHRQTKGAATDMVDLTPPRHIPTLPRAGPDGGTKRQILSTRQAAQQIFGTAVKGEVRRMRRRPRSAPSCDSWTATAAPVAALPRPDWAFRIGPGR